MYQENTRKPIDLRTEDKQIVPIDATCCLWFAFADPALNGPEKEDPIGPTYLPVPVDVDGILQLEVSANPAQQWEHHPGKLSNADGFGNDFHLENSKYKDAKYNSQHIEEPEEGIRLNTLVGMLDDQAIQKPLGVGPTIVDIGNNKILYLGFYDGREWSNNSGTIDVTLEVISRASPQT